MDKDEYIRRSCTSKRKYHNRTRANAAIDSMIIHERYAGQIIYKCRFCKRLHLGRPMRRKRKRK